MDAPADWQPMTTFPADGRAVEVTTSSGKFGRALFWAQQDRWVWLRPSGMSNGKIYEKIIGWRSPQTQ